MSYCDEAIESVSQSKLAFCKFLSANDTGKTGGHQCGIYISKPAISILFDEPGVKGENKDKFANIKWMDGTSTPSRFIYYGQGTRNEYRITRFGRGFPYLKPEYIGSLFILTEALNGEYTAFVLETEEEIKNFLDFFGLSSTETNNLIQNKTKFISNTYSFILKAINSYTDFPDSRTMSETARNIYSQIHKGYVSPDDEIIDWTKVEFKLYRALEDKIYKPKICGGFSSVDDFEQLAAQLMNRRKSRAGKSLENHLEEIFRESSLSFECQVKTEGNKTSDFVFPSSEAYHDGSFPTKGIVTLGAKTTCKDRWRQVLNEANRVRNSQKFLCTLQQGISESQLEEMEFEKLTLVVPRQYISLYPPSFHKKIWTVEQFIEYVKKIESIYKR